MENMEVTKEVGAVEIEEMTVAVTTSKASEKSSQQGVSGKDKTTTQSATSQEPKSTSLSNLDGAHDEEAPRKPLAGYQIPKRSNPDKEKNAAGSSREEEDPIKSREVQRGEQRRQDDRPQVTEREPDHRASRRDERSASPVRRIDRYDGGGHRQPEEFRGRRRPRDDYMDYDRAGRDRSSSRFDSNRSRMGGYRQNDGYGNLSGGMLHYGDNDLFGQSRQYGRGNLPYDVRGSSGSYQHDSPFRPVGNMTSGLPSMTASSMDNDAGSGFSPAPARGSHMRIPAPRAQPQVPTEGIHRNWSPNYMHTAKCDQCEENCKTVLQRCNDCSKQFCRRCMDGYLAGNSTHQGPTGGFDWNVPAAPAKSSKKRPAKKAGGSAKKKSKLTSSIGSDIDAGNEDGATMNTGSLPKASGTRKEKPVRSSSPFTGELDLEDEDEDSELQEALLASVQSAAQGSLNKPVSVSRPVATASRPAARLPTEDELDLGGIRTFRDAIEMLQRASNLPLDSVDSQQFDAERAEAFRDDPTLRAIVEIEKDPEKAKVFLQSATLIMRVVKAKENVRDGE